VAIETSTKATLHQRAMHEFKELVFISVYLYITLGAVILMKTAVLHTEGIAFTPWGIAIVKAVRIRPSWCSARRSERAGLHGCSLSSGSQLSRGERYGNSLQVRQVGMTTRRGDI
jgi:hypothetical protein